MTEEKTPARHASLAVSQGETGGTKQENKKEKTKMPQLKSGMTVRVYEKIKDIDPKGKERTRVQVFEGIILAVKKPKTPTGTILVRKISHNNIGVEKIFPLQSPLIDKIEIMKEIKTRRAKLYFLPTYKKRLKLKGKKDNK